MPGPPEPLERRLRELRDVCSELGSDSILNRHDGYTLNLNSTTSPDVNPAPT
jgi:hypothetical protein